MAVPSTAEYWHIGDSMMRLRVSTERITIFPKWGAVDSVEHHALGWVLSADQLTFLIPRDSFADEAAELIRQSGHYGEPKVIKDLAGLRRIISARRI